MSPAIADAADRRRGRLVSPFRRAGAPCPTDGDLLRNFSRRLCSFQCVAWFLVVVGMVGPSTTSTVSAQPAASEGSRSLIRNEAREGESAADRNEPASALDQLPPEIIYLLDRNNEPVPVPRDARLEDFLKFLKQGRRKSPDRPAPAVALIELTGVADDVRAILQARFVIQNLGGDEFVRVPLALHEAIVREELPSAGPGLMQYDGFDRTQGHVWWLRGAGRHELKLEISVPVKRQGANRRLQLTLPEATVSRLKLTTAFPLVVVKDSGGDVDVVNVPDQPSRIEQLGLGARLDLTWQPVVTESPLPPVLEADTTILAHAAPEKLLVEAYQRINVVQGTVSEVAVRLPTQSELVNIEGVRDYRSHRVMPDDPSRVIVQLNGPTSGQIQLKWTVRLTATEPRKYVLDGFQVEQARKQSGQIGLIPIEGERMTVTSSDHPHLLRINAVELRPLSAQVTRAYRFFNQPFRMAVGVETIAPYFTVNPKVSLGVSLNELTLEAVFTLRVLRGDLSSVELDWPNWKSDGWILEERPDELIEDRRSPMDETTGRLRLRLIEDQSEEWSLRIKARRAIRPGESVPVTLPRLIAPDAAPTLLRISDASNVSSEVTPFGETVLTVASPDRFESSSDSVAVPVRRERTYRVLTGEQSFSVRVNRLEQRVQLASLTSLSVSGTRLRAVQQMTFHVQHEPLSQVRIAIPEAWRNSPLEFQMDPDRSLSVEWSSSDEENGKFFAQIALPEPQLGSFTIEAVLEIPLSDDALSGQAGVEIPIFESPDHPFRQVDLEVEDDNESNLTVVEATWKPRPENSGRARWTAETPVSTVTVQFHPDGGGTQPFLISEADLQATWDRKGTARCVARFRVSGWFTRLPLVLPTQASPPIVTWDGRELSAPGELVAEAKPRHYTLRVRSSGAEKHDHVVTVSYDLPASQSFGVFNRWTLAAPQLPPGRWLADGSWLIRLPGDQHLFGYGSSVTPQFTWQRTGVFWSRVSRTELLNRTGEPALAAADSLGAPGNVYAFSQFGEIREFRFSTMSAPMILFVGASVSLLAGFLLLRVSWLQHVMTLWASAFAIALAGLWFRPQLEVLFQPMIVGCLFPLVAVWIQNARRRRVPPVLSFDPLMDLVESRSSVTRPPYGGDEMRAEPVLLRSPGSTHEFLQAEARSVHP